MKKIKIYKWPIIIFTTLILLVVSLTVPLPYYIEVPGGAEDIWNFKGDGVCQIR